GLHTEEVEARRAAKGFDASDVIATSPELTAVLHAIGEGDFSPNDPHRYRALTDDLRYRDPYMVLADFAAYRAAQAEVEALWRGPPPWGRAAAGEIHRRGW